MDKKRSDGAFLVKTSPASDNFPQFKVRDSSPAHKNTTQGSPARRDESNTPAAMENQGPPSLEKLSEDPLRTHRTWYPKYGRVQKCDWCNGRAAGTLHVCNTCSIRMCEGCARNRIWHGNRSHFIDADALDWVQKKAPRKPRAPRQPKTRPAKRAARSSPSEEPSTPAPCRRKLSMATTNSRADEDDDLDDDGDNFANAGTRRGQFSAPANPRHDFGPPLPNYHDHSPEALPYHQAPMHGGYAPHGPSAPTMPGYYGPPAPAMPASDIGPTMAAPSTRRGARQAAARAKLSISEQSRRASRGRFGDDDDEYGDNEDDEDEDDDVYEEKGLAENVNDMRRRRGDRLTGRTSVRSASQVGGTDRDDTSSPLANAPGLQASVEHPILTPQDREHDRRVLDIYDSIYGNRPNLDPHQVRTQIPEQWYGGWHGMAPQYHYEQNPYNPYPAPHYPAHPYGQYHGDVQAGTHGHQHMYPPPAPPAHPQYSAHHPEYQYQPYPNPHPGNPYTPTARPAPAYHPYNELAPHEVEHMQQDRVTLDHMRNAWNHNQILLRLVADNHRVYAIGLLWDVFELRRTRVLVNNNSQTVRWFMNERDRQVHIEHEGHVQRQVRASMSRGPTPVLAAAAPRGEGYGDGAEARSAYGDARSVNATVDVDSDADGNEAGEE
ncbi:hypothetical protein C8A01DRAFT_12144 [Parachaetomium inaequale]|uniref:Uncharacterized protein n=1 Tax=Parachaetomium inaequale TaxID=2588326 RepID=A0AAN6PTG8_9PEZI|nr:hypothetical protein C8A01DRAFT_12144 [Parachaetomium inaequale]